MDEVFDRRIIMKKLLFAFATALILTAGFANPAPAQDFPQRPIHLIIAFGPGGGSDIIGRILAESLQTKLGQAVVVENKPGAGGILGNDMVARATPDGYTLGIMTAGQLIAAVTTKKMPYDSLTAFAPVGQIATASLMIVTRPDFLANDVKELVAYAKANPGKVVFASPGFAATQHFAGELFKQIAKIDLLHVPFRTTPETHQRGPWSACRHHVRYGVGIDRTCAVRPAQGTCGYRQGSLPGSFECAGRRRVRLAARLRRYHLVRCVCAARHATGRHRQAEQSAQR